MNADKPTSAWMPSNRTYWLCQIAGWGGIAAIHVSLLMFVNRFSLAMAAGYLLASTLSVGVTHVLRGLMKKRGWLRMSMPRIAARLFVSCLSGGFVVGVGALGFETVAFPEQGAVPGIGRWILVSGYWSALILCWSVLYVALHLYRVARTAETERWKLHAAAREAELGLLKSQLDPHFMFNSLNGIRALISEDPERAQEMVTRLAGLLRHALRTNGSALVPLGEEIRMVRSYLMLESVRLEERLHYRIEIDDDALRVQVPPMIIQTLVENAIKHGVATLVDGGEVRVTAGPIEGRLAVRVENSGRLKEQDGGCGVGLANARERLRLLYGERGELNLEEAPGGIVVAEVFIPLEVPVESSSHR